jgi:hypothetical protein
MSRSQRIVLVLILTGQLMAVLDASIVNVAIPTIRLDSMPPARTCSSSSPVT